MTFSYLKMKDSSKMRLDRLLSVCGSMVQLYHSTDSRTMAGPNEILTTSLTACGIVSQTFSRERWASPVRACGNERGSGCRAGNRAGKRHEHIHDITSLARDGPDVSSRSDILILIKRWRTDPKRCRPLGTVCAGFNAGCGARAQKRIGTAGVCCWPAPRRPSGCTSLAQMETK